MTWHFPVFIVASCAAFVAILRIALAGRRAGPRRATVLSVAGVVVAGEMAFAKPFIQVPTMQALLETDRAG